MSCFLFKYRKDYLKLICNELIVIGCYFRIKITFIIDNYLNKYKYKVKLEGGVIMYEKITHQEQNPGRSKKNIQQKGNSNNKKNAESMKDVLLTIWRIRRNPKSLTSQDLRLLQHSIGNQAVLKLLSEIKEPEAEKTSRKKEGDAVKTASKEDTYVVKPGDYLGLIASRYNTTVDELVRLNNIKDKNKIYPGQVIILPQKSDKPKPKDNKNEIKSENGNVNEKSVKPGDKAKTEKTGDNNLVSTAEEVIFGNEGAYSTVAKDDNGALSIGKIQWHGSRARDLLNRIKGKNPDLTKNILTKSIYNNLDSSDEYWSTKTLTDSEAAAISKLLNTAEGKSAQDEQSKIDVGGYINIGKGLGITDNQALVYFADLYNQSPANAKKIVKAAGGGKGLSLDELHEAALANSVMGKYKDRRKKTYNSCKKIAAGTDNNAVSEKDNKESSPDKDDTKGSDSAKDEKSEDQTPYADMSRKEKEEVVFGKDRKYYKTESEASKNMVGITVKVWKYNSKGELYSSKATITINKNLQADVQAIFNEIYESDEKFPIKSVGAYNFRKMAASSNLSHHSYGTAIDINPDENYMIKNDKIIAGTLYEPGKNKYSMAADGSVVKAFKKHGWIWGGDWKSSKDYMHFSFLGN